MKKSKTKRGFGIFEFKDYNGIRCSLQESSLAAKECIWLGIDKDKERNCVIEEILSTRMHLVRKMAREIGMKLIEFADRGWEMFR